MYLARGPVGFLSLSVFTSTPSPLSFEQYFVKPPSRDSAVFREMGAILWFRAGQGSRLTRQEVAIVLLPDRTQQSKSQGTAEMSEFDLESQ